MHRAWSAMATGLLLTACVTPPAAPPPALPRAAPVGASDVGAGAWPAAHWWRTFGDPQVDALVALAQGTAPSLRVARARLDAAAAATDAVRARTGARLTGSGGVSRNRLSENGLISSHLLGFESYSQADAGLHLDLDFDWWGRESAALNAALDRGRAAAADAAAGELILVTTVVAEYMGWQNDGERLATARELLDLLHQQQELQTLRSDEGADDAAPVEELHIQTTQARGMVMQRQASQSRHRLALAALLGLIPENLPLTERGIAVVPAVEAPADLGLGLIGRRPDVVASRWRVEAGLEDVAEARAGYYPDLRLSALAGLSSLELSKALSPASQVGSLGATLYLPVFDLRGVRARYGVSRAALELAVAGYDEVIAAAAREVAMQMLNCRVLVLERSNVTERMAATDKLRAVAAVRRREGMDDARMLLGEEIEVLRQRDTALEIDGNLALARLALVKALGGAAM